MLLRPRRRQRPLETVELAFDCIDRIEAQTKAAERRLNPADSGDEPPTGCDQRRPWVRCPDGDEDRVRGLVDRHGPEGSSGPSALSTGTGWRYTPCMQSPKRLRVVLLGAGSLGRAFLRRLSENPGSVELVGVVTAHHGRRIDPAGIAPETALHLAETAELGTSGPEGFEAQLEHAGADAVVECIPQNIRSGEPALGLHRVALDRGIHVVTANKTPVALGYRDLRHRAAKSGAQIRFEASVLDGLPVFGFAAALFGQRVVRARGVLNATSSVVLECVGCGGTRSRGLARAQAQGIAEADPVLDLDGWDAAAKAAVIANVLMGGSLKVVDVARTGCEGLKDQAIQRAAAEGHAYRLVATIERGETGVSARVEPVALAADDPLHPLRGPQGGIEFETDHGHRYALLQRSAGLADAAGGLLSDCRALISGAPQL